MGPVRPEKVTYVALDLFSYYHDAQKYKNILVTTVCSIYAQQYSIFQDGGHFQHENHFHDSLIQTCAILMILVSNHTFLTMQNLNFDFMRQIVKIHHVG